MKYLLKKAEAKAIKDNRNKKKPDDPLSKAKEKRRLTKAQKEWIEQEKLAKKQKAKKNELRFLRLCKDHGLPEPIPEHMFAKDIGRKWRIDYYFEREFINRDGWKEVVKIALEVEGGVWSKGRHVQPKGFLADMEKYNHLAVCKIQLYRIQPKDLLSMDLIKKLKTLLKVSE